MTVAPSIFYQIFARVFAPLFFIPFCASRIARRYGHNNEIMEQVSSTKTVRARFSEMVRSIRYNLSGSYSGSHGEILYRDTKKIFEKMVNYLDEHDMEYSLSDSSGYRSRTVLAVRGIKITYNAPDGFQGKGNTNSGAISVSISPYNFEESFDLYLKLNSLFVDALNFYVQIFLNEGYVYTDKEEDCAALLLLSPEWFSMSKKRVGDFECSKLKLHFSIYDNNTDYGKQKEFVLGIGYNPSEIDSSSVVELVSKLYDLKLISRKND